MANSKNPIFEWITTAIIGENGQITIPASVRRQDGFVAGDPVSLFFSSGYLVIVPERQHVNRLAETISAVLPEGHFVAPIPDSNLALAAEVRLTPAQLDRVRVTYEHFGKDTVSREELLTFGQRRFGSRNALMFLRKIPAFRAGWGLYRLPISQIH